MLRGAVPGLAAASPAADGAAPDDGYLVDFGELKKLMRQLCADLNERFLLPTANEFIGYSIQDGQVHMRLSDGSSFSFPEGDVVLVPLNNVSVEQLAVLFARRFLDKVGVDHLRHRRVTQVTLCVAESAGQEAKFTVEISPSPSASTTADTAVKLTLC